MIAFGDELCADHDVDRARVHRADELGRAERRPDRVRCHDCRACLREELGDFVGDALDPGTARDKAVFLPAFRASFRWRHHMAAMVAGQTVHQPVLDHPGCAIRALETVAAVAAQGQRREAAAVEEQQGLLAGGEIGLDLADE